jgi:DNA-3-methyladenine glycosylase
MPAPRRESLRLVKLPRRFYLRPAITVARDLLGTYLVSRSAGQALIGRIVEVEAYLGERDPASHAYRGKTPRNEVMFGEGGHLYVYFTYGMHHCCNVVTGPEGRASAVLLRAVEPVRGVDLMRERREGGTRGRVSDAALTNGPGKLCQALGITRELNGADLCGERIWIGKTRGPRRRMKVARSPRVGISQGQHHLWRFFLPPPTAEHKSR